MAALLKSNLSKVRSPLEGQKVYKDECVFSFDSPDHETGLYVCMNTFLGFGKNHVERHYRKTGNAVFLHMRRIKRELPQQADDVTTKKPTKIAIGVEGGFDVGQPRYEMEEINSIVVLPDWVEIPLNDPDLPDQVKMSASSILAVDSALRQEELAAMNATWDGELRVVSKHAASLVQIPNPPKIPPRGWKCSQCDLSDNLWLNLTDGVILCGRKYHDGTGGNNHAIHHYQATRHPLAVKLGTITATGGDVYSYDEDEMVEDPHLAKHLQHFGIDAMKLEKTDKTMAELEIDYNQRVGEWDVIQEAGCQLKPLYGPGYTGIRNLGNSCYMNSTMQVLFSIPDFERKYYVPSKQIFDSATSDPTADLTVQLAKFAHGLLSGEYSIPPESSSESLDLDSTRVQPQGIRPQMFKSLVGRGHPEFSTKRQQDAEEFLLHLFNLIEKSSRGSGNPCDGLKFQVEERIECTRSKKVKYTSRTDYLLSLPVAVEAGSNKEEVVAYEEKKRELLAQKKNISPGDIVRLKVPLSACLDAFAMDEFVTGFYSTAVNEFTTIKKTTRIATFPNYLLIHVKKYTMGEDWLPKKIDVSLDVPDILDLKYLRARGKQPGEEELPEGGHPLAPPKVNIDESVVAQLVEMGFALEGCRKAVYHTDNTGIESAMNWIMEHISDPDFTEPLRLPGGDNTKSSTTNFVPDESAVVTLSGMGFTRQQAIKALKATNNSLERAADWIFSHSAELEEPMEMDQSSVGGGGAIPQLIDDSAKYRLVAFISHMGTSTLVGHYVCHVLKEGRWVIFNDEKVALSEQPPKDLAYIYLYQRL